LVGVVDVVGVVDWGVPGVVRVRTWGCKLASWFEPSPCLKVSTAWAATFPTTLGVPVSVDVPAGS
jgi:hypothetical protein